MGSRQLLDAVVSNAFLSYLRKQLGCGVAFAFDFETREDHGQVAHGNGGRRLNRLIRNRGVTLSSLGHDLGDVRPKDIQRAYQHIGNRERGQRSVEAQPFERGLKTGDGECCHNCAYGL